MQPQLDDETRIVASLRQIMRAVDLHSHQLMEEVGLTGPQLACLRAVRNEGLATPGRLARMLHVSPATVTGILTRLEKRGLLRRSRGDGDRRTVQVQLTPEGESLVIQAPSLLQDQFREQLTLLQEWERTQILAVLQRVASMMGAGALDASPHLVTDGRHLAAPATPSEETPAGPPTADPTLSDPSTASIQGS